MTGPSCRGFRELLGVYVVGAIEPAERASVEEHLAWCESCREELAGLAVLPALLHRISPAEAERLTGAWDGADGPGGSGGSGGPGGSAAEPGEEALAPLLGKVRARRRAGRVRGLLAAAAAVVIAAAGGAAATRAISAGPGQAPSARHRVLDSATASSGGLSATVRYDRTAWGTAMWVRVTGLREWTACKFWVITTAGRRELAGAWTLGPAGSRLWYPVGVPQARVAGFVLTWGNGASLRIPVA